jgi:hypothetical protein
MTLGTTASIQHHQITLFTSWNRVPFLKAIAFPFLDLILWERPCSATRFITSRWPHDQKGVRREQVCALGACVDDSLWPVRVRS